MHTYMAGFQDNLGKVVAKCQTTLFSVQKEIKGGGGDNQNCKM